MTPERWQQICKVFQTVVEIAPGQRADFLDEACATDQTLRNEVESLLLSDADSWELIEKPALEVAAPMLADVETQLTPGQLLGHYEIVSQVGTGGMGEIYLAKDQRLNRSVALKLLPNDYTADKDRLRRFQQEAQAASALNHPNILTIHELGDVDGQQFIATEFVEGETLRQRAKSVGFSVHDALNIAIQIAGALTAAHKAGIIHRDIKPENIMLRPDGYVKVLDFGLAKLTEQQAPKVQANSIDSPDISSGLVMGTVKYMSPEQARGLSVDSRSDLFSLGVVLYEMIAGRPPFEGQTTNHLIRSILKNEPPPLRDCLPKIPETLQQIVFKSLSKNATDRYQTAEELVVDLELLRQQIDASPGFQGYSAFGSVTRQKARSAPQGVSFRLGGGTKTSSVQFAVSQIKQHKGATALGLFTLIVLVGGVTYPLKRWISRRAGFSEQIKISRLSSTGNVSNAAISPDGKYLVYAMQDAAGLESLWIKELATNAASQIVAPREVYTKRLVFSRDGRNIYYVTSDDELYRLSVIGGTSEKVLNDVPYMITFSLDGRQFAFLRDKPQGITELVISTTDGKAQTVVATRKAPDYFEKAGPTWSPDGNSIACVAVNAAEGFQRVFDVNIQTGAQKPLTNQKWDQGISDLAWLPDSSSILLIASNSSFSSEIWRLSYPSGELQRITNDANRYYTLSISNDSRRLLTLEITSNIDLWIARNSDSDSVTRITPGRHDGRGGVTWTPDGRIVYTSDAGSNSDIWIMNADGTNQKQLTTDVHNDVWPSVTSDGRYIVFESNRTGADHIWRMDIDGSNEKQLTFGAVERSPNCSPDSTWIVFNSWDSGKAAVWKTTIEGDTPVQISNAECFYPAVSPDGKLIACLQSTTQRLIFPFAGGKTKQIDLPVPGWTTGVPVWTLDSQAQTYNDWTGPVVNFWNKPIDGSPPTQLTHFASDQKGASYGVLPYAWSPNGKDLAYARYEDKRDILLISNLK